VEKIIQDQRAQYGIDRVVLCPTIGPSVGTVVPGGSSDVVRPVVAVPALFHAADHTGLGLISVGTPTGPLSDADLQAIGLRDLAVTLRQDAGRDINFMIYGSTEAAIQRAPSIILPKISR